ncbi:MAG: hypothetical protein BMS9Abin07_1609 [Acidimicrobiia bacterium]|nr:MAG: hypothetical protein BMS9Abin07_1609 [Acidimicrobiia bacterium]
MVTRRLGRAAELDTIDGAIAAGLSGERRLVVIVGDAASGRSQLLEAAAAVASDHGANVAAARGHEAAVSDIGSVADDLGITGEGDVAGILVVDDAQWADPTSIGLLQRTFATSSDGITIVLGHEPLDGIRALALERMSNAAARTGRVDQLVLGPLTTAELREVADGAVAERIMALTGGTYDDVDRLVVDWVEDGILGWNDGRLEALGALPDTWTGADGPRPEDLDAPARKLVEAVSLAGRPIPLDVAADLVGLSGDATLGIGEELVDQGLLTQSRAGFASPNALASARVAAILGGVRIAHLNGELARAFTVAGYADRSPGLVGGYHLKAGAPEAAIELLDSALTAAIAEGALAEAVPLIDAALSAIDEEGVGTVELEGRLRLERAKYYQIAGWSELAAEDFQIASRYLEGAARVDALGFLAAVEDNRQDSQTAEVYAAAAIGEATAIDEPLKAGSLLLLQARILSRIGFPAETDASQAKGSAILEEGGNPFQRFLAAQNTARIALDRGKAGEAEPLFERVYTRADQTAGLAAKADAAAWLARAQFLHGHPDKGLESVATAMEVAEATASSGPIFLGYMARSEGAGRFTAYEEALQAADAMLGYVLQQLPDWENAARYLRARALLGLGRTDEAADEIESALELCPDGINGWRWRLRIEAFRFNVLAATGAEWPKERAEDLTDELLQGQWLDVAAELMAVRAGIEEDEGLARQAAALALQLGIATTAAAAIEAGGLWSDPAGAAVASKIKDTQRHIPERWQQAWAAQPGIAAALGAPEVVDEELAAAAVALQSDLDAALLAAGLGDPETTLSPAQRREQGLVRRQPGRARRGALLLGAAAAVVILAIGGGALAATVFAPDEPEVVVQPTTPVTTTIPRMEDTKITEDLPRFFAKYWETFGANQARTGGSDASGVRQPEGHYWRNSRNQSEFFASPIVVGQRLVIGSLDGQVYFMDRAKGDVLSTSSSTDDRITTTAAGGKITAEGSDLFLAIVPSSDGVLYAYDAGSAATIWSNDEVDATGTPAVDGAAALIYVGGSDGAIHALNTGSGEEVWRWPAEGEEELGTITTDITLAQGTIYFGVGSDLWQLDIASKAGIVCDNLAGGDYLTPVVSEGVIYAANSDGFVYFLNTEPCAWARKSILVQEQLTVKPAVHDGFIYQPGANGVTAYDLEGKRVWGPSPIREGLVQAPRVQGSPAVAGGLVYFGAEDGYVYALDAKTGELVWEWDEGVPIRAAVAVTDRVVYVATSAGQVVAIAPIADERLGETTTTTDGVSGPGTTAPGGSTVPPDTAVPGDDGTTSTTVRKGGGGGGTF